MSPLAPVVRLNKAGNSPSVVVCCPSLLSPAAPFFSFSWHSSPHVRRRRKPTDYDRRDSEPPPRPSGRRNALAAQDPLHPCAARRGAQSASSHRVPHAKLAPRTKQGGEEQRQWKGVQRHGQRSAAPCPFPPKRFGRTLIFPPFRPLFRPVRPRLASYFHRRSAPPPGRRSEDRPRVRAGSAPRLTVWREQDLAAAEPYAAEDHRLGVWWLW